MTDIDDDFDSPSKEERPKGDRVEVSDLVDKLLIVRPMEFVTGFKTEYKPDGADAVFANIAIPGENVMYKSALIMQGFLIGDFKNSIGKNLVGVIYLGQKKPGQKPPYMFRDLNGNEKAMAVARPWMAANKAEFIKPLVSEFDSPSAETQRAAAKADPWADDEPPF